MVPDIKKEVMREVDYYFSELNQLSHKIHTHPELAFEEKRASAWLSEYLQQKGFITQLGLKNLNTAFKAQYAFSDQNTKPNICFMAEYDALPNIGHACGHNIIATSSVGAAVVVKKIIEKYQLNGTLTVMGTPAEENGSGKILLLEDGQFEGIDYAILMHPADQSMPDDISFAAAIIEYSFKGVPAHAAAVPWMGRSALNGVIQMYNAVNAMRLHFKDYCRIHAYIKDGGKSHNTIVDGASIVFNLRSLQYSELLRMIEIVDHCAQGAALATETSFEKKVEAPIIKEIKNNTHLVELVRKNLDEIDENYVERNLNQGIGSTDVANVTHALPAIQYYIQLAENTGTHTKEFQIASGDERGEICLKKAITINALTALDLLMEAQ